MGLGRRPVARGATRWAHAGGEKGRLIFLYSVHIGSEIAEINFALKEGHTIVGVMDTKKAMRFYIGNDVMDEQKYE